MEPVGQMPNDYEFIIASYFIQLNRKVKKKNLNSVDQLIAT